MYIDNGKTMPHQFVFHVRLDLSLPKILCAHTKHTRSLIPPS